MGNPATLRTLLGDRAPGCAASAPRIGDWDRLIPGHPGPGGRLGTKQDAQNLLTFLQDASAAVKAQAQAGKCWDGVEKELKLPKYESWPGYATGLPFVLRRYCGLWGRGT